MGIAVTRHMHLDPVGGIAGDMFVSAMLDTSPDIRTRCWKDLESAGLLQQVAVETTVGHSHGLAAQRLSVTPVANIRERTGNYLALKQWLEQSSLHRAVLMRALSLLEILAQAEATVHGVAIQAVHFHEVADWDSLVDIVAAASVIEHSKIDSWSCAALPLGSGLVKTQHGQLPVPAPATVCLLQGLSVWDDGIAGERVTPTGAAIVRYLFTLEDGTVQHNMQRPAGTIASVGCGAGIKELPDRPNIVRCTLIEQHCQLIDAIATDAQTQFIDQVVQIGFDIDDMTAEELAIAMSYIRASCGVLDASYQLGSGKKGRSVFVINVLCLPEQEESVCALCFEETTTLGMRVQPVRRRILKRKLHATADESGAATVKTATRASGTTAKVESDDLQSIPGLQARRLRAQQLRESFES